MKHINAKRIAAVVTGAALLGAGLAFASQVTYGNVTIVNNLGQPVVQVVLGHASQPSDGVAAGNIAAAIGNLAYTTKQVVPTVNTTHAQQVLGVSMSSPKYTLANQQVWLNESATTFASGTYSFTALIGSVLNYGVQSGSLQNTKYLPSNPTYAYPTGSGTFKVSSSPASSPYSDVGYVPLPNTVTASTNGGGLSFISFTNGTYDNILQVSNTNLPALVSNYGNNGENEYLWLTGFPVYDQQSGVQALALLDANGAYQITFNKPINVKTSSGSINTQSIRFLGQNWTIINYSAPSGPLHGNAVAGGHIQLASSMTPMQTLYVGDNMTAGPYKIQLSGLGNTNSNGISQASIAIYKGNSTVPVNTSIANTGQMLQFNVSGTMLYVKVNSTFNGGSFSYQKWAKMQAYSNVFNVTSGKAFNTTSNPNWYTVLEWTNATSSTSGNVDSLASIIIYGNSAQSQTLLQGQSFNFITSPSIYKVQFVGQTLSSASYDPVTVTTQYVGSVAYSSGQSGALTPNAFFLNSGTGNFMPASSSNMQVLATNITEPAEELVVSSSIPNAFSFAGQTTSTLTYDLTPYTYTPTNVITANSSTGWVTNVILASSVPMSNTMISSTHPLTITVSGYAQNSPITKSVTLYSANSVGGNTTSLGVAFNNVTSIQLNRALPGLTVSVYATNTAATNGPNSIMLGQLAPEKPVLLYSQTGKSFYLTADGGNVIYNQQNGQPTSTFSITPVTSASTANGYFTYSIKEYNVPSSTSSNDVLSFAITNATGGVGVEPLFQLNSTSVSGTTIVAGGHGNVSYTSSQNKVIQVPQGFITERGSKVASITQSSLTFDLAKSVDELQFAVSPVNTTITTSYKTYGPFSVGAQTNIPNVTVAKITATPVLSGEANYTITGIGNLTANPIQESSPVLLKNLTTTPLVVLDSQVSNPNEPAILIGSGYVNTLSAAFQKAAGISNSTLDVPSGVIETNGNQILVAGWTADQTLSAANKFIQALYAQAASS